VTGGSAGSRSGAGNRQEVAGGTAAPRTGTYEIANLFGRQTGHRVMLREGEQLPPLPRGFTWVVPVSDEG
jgi:hypothetical protein